MSAERNWSERVCLWFRLNRTLPSARIIKLPLTHHVCTGWGGHLHDGPAQGELQLTAGGDTEGRERLTQERARVLLPESEEAAEGEAER